MTPRVLWFGPSSAVVKGDGWRTHIRVIGWFRPKLMIHTFTDPPGEEIPQDSIYPVPEVRPPHVTPTQVRQPGGRS